VGSAAGLLGVSAETATVLGATVGDITATGVLWGYAGAAENTIVTGVTEPGSDLSDAAAEGFMSWGVGGAIGGAAGKAFGLGGSSATRDALSEASGPSASGKLYSQEFLDKWSSGMGEHGPDWIWPPNRGFDGPARPNTLAVGDTIDRITAVAPDGTIADGGFASPEGQAFATRALPPDRLRPPFITVTYKVLKPLPEDVVQGRTAAWFDQPGQGIQYEFPGGIQRYVDQGYLEPIEKSAQ